MTAASDTRWILTACASLACATVGSARPAAPAPFRPPLEDVADAVESGAECAEGSAPDADVCVHLPGTGGPLAPARPAAHRERSGRWAAYDQIPRLPECPADYDAYRYPVPPGLSGGHYVVSGYDLDKPDETQRRGRRLSHVGHGGVDLPQKKGTPIHLVNLENQEGKAEVLYTGPLFGTTVLTRHAVREGGRVHDYVVLFGHLDQISGGVAPGSVLEEGAVVGTVGDTGSRELVHLHFETRRVREGVDLADVAAGPNLLADSVTIVCDPRNVLPLRGGAEH